MNFYIKFDETGSMMARYDRRVHGENIPADAIPVSDDVFWASINEPDGVWELDPATKAIKKHPLPGPSPEHVQRQKVALVQAHLDATAQSFNFDNIANAVTYAEEPAVPEFQAQGQALRAWRSLVWEKCYAIFDEAQAGARQIPTDQELIGELPALQLPQGG